MTYREKLKKDTGRGINGFGCPSDHKYEERRSFKDHCSCISCCDCWNREIEEKEQKPMKYKVGDTVLMQAQIVAIDEADKEFPVEVLHPSGNKEWVYIDEIFELPKPEKTYEQGLEDAWELLDRLEHAVSVKVMDDVFGYSEIGDILDNYTPQEALAKLKAYEEESEIKVGDVVSNGTHVLLCVKEDYGYGYFYFLDKDGSYIFLTKENLKKSKLTKTGKHIDIESLLEQIKGDANE